MGMGTKYITVQEFKELAGVCEQTVRNWIRKNIVYGRKFGQKWYVLVDDEILKLAQAHARFKADRRSNLSASSHS